MKKIMVILLTVVFSSFWVLGQAYSQEQTSQEVSEEAVVEYAFGEVKSVADKSLVVINYNMDSDDYEDLEFIIDEETFFEEVDSLDEIVQGDYVEVVYEMNGEARLAKSIYLDTLSESEMYKEEAASEESQGAMPSEEEPAEEAGFDGFMKDSE